MIGEVMCCSHPCSQLMEAPVLARILLQTASEDMREDVCVGVCGGVGVCVCVCCCVVVVCSGVVRSVFWFLFSVLEWNVALCSCAGSGFCVVCARVYAHGF